MNNIICTITTQSHLYKAKAFVKSVEEHSITSCVLIVDSLELSNLTGFNVDYISVLDCALATQIKTKYKNNPDKLRWALKPLYLKYLLEKGYDQVIYCDNDIFFYSSPEFLFEKLKTSSFILTPHHYKADPLKDQHWLEANFRVGLYNAGFIGVSQKGIPILDWWANCCLYNIKKSFWRGLFDDQKYLDLVPVLFDEVEIIKNKGCNLAGWNAANYTFERNEFKQLLVNGDLLVFIHFTNLSLSNFSNDNSAVNLEYQLYTNELQKYNPAYKFIPNRKSRREWAAFAYFVFWKLARLFEK